MMLADFERVFRPVSWLIALLLGWFSLATMLAEVSKTVPALADWTIAAVPFRGDLLADLATVHAGTAISGAQTASTTKEAVVAREKALSEARQSLLSSPHLSRTWLLVAKLESFGSNNSAVSEALRMSYLTAPTDTDLIPDRLRILSASTVIDDGEDLKRLARSDIRLILTRRPDLKPAIIEAYRQGSPAAQTYLDETVASLDPGFAASLHP
jgi:hypothetical protein